MEEARDCDGKSGKDLFLELLRLLPSAQAEDYFLMGKWKDDDIQLDYDLLWAHRREAGADDPPALEELEIPPMPGDRPAAAVGTFGPLGNVGMYQRPAQIATVFAGQGVTRVLAKPVTLTTTASALRPMPPRAAPTPAMVAAAGVPAASGGPSAELRQIALFIAKWKLEATKTKLLLARLTPPRRRWVMTKFTQTGTTIGSTAQLEAYIARCERDNSWAAAGGAATSIGAASGLKRPLTASTLGMDLNKRPKLGQSSYGSGLMRPGAGAGLLQPNAYQHNPSAYARTSPAWLGGASAGSVARVGVGAPLMPARGSYGQAYGGAKPGIPKPAGAMMQRPTGYGTPRLGVAAIRPAAPKGYSGVIKPAVPKGKGAKAGSLIANLLRM